MKIHTTQNLTSLAGKSTTNKNIIPNEIRIQKPDDSLTENTYSTRSMRSNAITFRAGQQNSDKLKKIINTAKKMVGEMKKKGQPELQRGDKILNSSFFNALLKVADYETVVQAAIAAVICIALRPLTIMALPTKKGKTKEDNIYASSHSMASGMVGLVTAFALTAPFKSGEKYVMKHMYKDLDIKTLKRLNPHLDEKSIVDSAGKRLEEKLWKNINDGKDFCREVKDCQKLPEFRQLADASEETFEKVLGVIVDFTSQKGKSFNELVTKDGKNIYEALDFSRIGIKFKEGEKEVAVLLKDIDKGVLESLITDAKGIADSNLGKLDINSVFPTKKVVNGKEIWEMADIKKWKDVNGANWKLDLDTAFVSSAFDTANYFPRTNGQKILIGKEEKLATFQKNVNGDELGSLITAEMLQAEKNNEALIKSLTWFPDLSFRVPIAVSTIALIPWILKNVFGMEKRSKKAPEQLAQEKLQTEAQKDKVEDKKQTETVNFKGKGGDKPSWLAKKMGELYGKPLIESPKMAKVSELVSKIPGGGTQAMITVGSLIQSGVYVQQTLSNKDFQQDRKRTLAINQGLCFAVPTVAAYAVDNAIKNWVKSKEYRYAGWQERGIEMAQYEGKKDLAKELKSGLGNRLKGVRILAGLATFTLIYRYATPVIVTPIANWIGDKFGERAKAKKLAAAQEENQGK